MPKTWTSPHFVLQCSHVLLHGGRPFALCALTPYLGANASWFCSPLCFLVPAPIWYLAGPYLSLYILLWSACVLCSWLCLRIFLTNVIIMARCAIAIHCHIGPSLPNRKQDTSTTAGILASGEFLQPIFFLVKLLCRWLDMTVRDMVVRRHLKQSRLL